MTDAAIAPLLVNEPASSTVTTERRPTRIVLVAVAVIFLVLFLLLPQPSLQQGFLAAADPVGLSAETVKLVAEVLQAAEAAGRGAGASAGSAALWAVTARRLCQPYIAK